MGFKSGFVTVVGRPNVGKSTLINKILGEKIAIMSDKPQTTRNKIQAIYQSDNSQVIFIDTPGLHKPKNKLGEFMVSTAYETIKEVDVVLFLVDESTKIGLGDKYILEKLKMSRTPVILVINKMDLINPENYIKIVENYKEYDFIEEIISISALNNINVDILLNMVNNLLPEGPMYYPSDMITDQPEKVIAAEIIREKLLHYLNDEVPHGVAVEIEKMRKRKNSDIVDINATIICERETHKGIIIGKNGRKLKGVGKSAREDIEKLLGSKVYLEIWVKVRQGWRDNDSHLKNFGYNK
ncbi:GTPase Era [Helicovermis profundi]|uniref:GTPase Era n=1 Tax=Helicovermis profundi TaxID=3065157 RepID=A0AAU9EFY4_9FIRM|nr:GTPase Era [Clostridia bacterium S502]